jgi:hypothetical protein
LRRNSLKAIGRALDKPSSLFIASWPPVLRRPIELADKSGHWPTFAGQSHLTSTRASDVATACSQRCDRLWVDVWVGGRAIPKHSALQRLQAESNPHFTHRGSVFTHTLGACRPVISHSNSAERLRTHTISHTQVWVRWTDKIRIDDKQRPMDHTPH